MSQGVKLVDLISADWKQLENSQLVIWEVLPPKKVPGERRTLISLSKRQTKDGNILDNPYHELSKTKLGGSTTPAANNELADIETTGRPIFGKAPSPTVDSVNTAGSPADLNDGFSF